MIMRGLIVVAGGVDRATDCIKKRLVARYARDDECSRIEGTTT